MHTIICTASHCKVVIDLFEAWPVVIGVQLPEPLVVYSWRYAHCSLPKVYQNWHVTSYAAHGPEYGSAMRQICFYGCQRYQVCMVGMLCMFTFSTSEDVTMKP